MQSGADCQASPMSTRNRRRTGPLLGFGRPKTTGAGGCAPPWPMGESNAPSTGARCLPRSSRFPMRRLMTGFSRKRALIAASGMALRDGGNHVPGKSSRGFLRMPLGEQLPQQSLTASRTNGCSWENGRRACRVFTVVAKWTFPKALNVRRSSSTTGPWDAPAAGRRRVLRPAAQANTPVRRRAASGAWGA
jgi:hypothetical protein